MEFRGKKPRFPSVVTRIVYKGRYHLFLQQVPQLDFALLKPFFLSWDGTALEMVAKLSFLQPILASNGYLNEAFKEE